MQNTKIIIKTKSKSYPVYFGNETLNRLRPLIRKKLPNVKKICIISDKNLPSKILKKLRKSLKKYNLIVFNLSANEKIKSFEVANKIINTLLVNSFNRSDCIIALGGGTVGDLSAFVSSITKRGLKFINIPTTLLAQSDASIGGKTAINSKQGKNLIGTFYQPEFVLIDVSMLNSLPKREIICGYGEILKHSLIMDKKFFLWLCNNAKKIINEKDKNLLNNAIVKSCKIKSKIITRDEKEKNLRMILNFGHTFAHGFEGAKNYSKKLNHGEAVLLGMIVASQLSYKKKLLSLQNLILIKKHYLSLNLPMKIRQFFKKSEVNKIINFMKKDKKNVDEKINLILIKNIGKVTKPNNFTINDNELKKFLVSEYI
tara:strand:- start:430 stop:1542 length:1113 start_codon:yes stop_codon:yes gene_type:complete